MCTKKSAMGGEGGNIKVRADMVEAFGKKAVSHCGRVDDFLFRLARLGLMLQRLAALLAGEDAPSCAPLRRAAAAAHEQGRRSSRRGGTSGAGPTAGAGQPRGSSGQAGGGSRAAKKPGQGSTKRRKGGGSDQGAEKRRKGSGKSSGSGKLGQLPNGLSALYRLS
jgi:hypothetical protein